MVQIFMASMVFLVATMTMIWIITVTVFKIATMFILTMLIATVAALARSKA
jgi:hypothetical protein